MHVVQKIVSSLQHLNEGLGNNFKKGLLSINVNITTNWEANKWTVFKSTAMLNAPPKSKQAQKKTTYFG